jgi:transposase
VTAYVGKLLMTRANMRFVETKTPEQQTCLMLHRTRHLFIRQQTSVINAIRAHMAEYGIVARVGRTGVAELLAVAADPTDRRLPEVARTCVAALSVQLRMLKAQILEFDRRIGAWHQSNQTSKQLDQVPGIGPALATALVGKRKAYADDWWHNDHLARDPERRIIRWMSVSRK